MNVCRELWADIRSFFLRRVQRCKDCFYGNPVTCWRGDCASFPFRDIARRIDEAGDDRPSIRVPRHVAVENEILEALRSCGGGPVYPSQIMLRTTRSKVNKSHAISRLVRQGRVIEKRLGDYSRLISLPNQRNNKEGK